MESDSAGVFQWDRAVVHMNNAIYLLLAERNGNGHTILYADFMLRPMISVIAIMIVTQRMYVYWRKSQIF
jgi:hypothetical protein